MARNLFAGPSDLVRFVERLRWHHDLRTFAGRTLAFVGGAALLGVLACLSLGGSRRAARRRQGLCERCGYD